MNIDSYLLSSILLLSLKFYDALFLIQRSNVNCFIIFDEQRNLGAQICIKKPHQEKLDANDFGANRLTDISYVNERNQKLKNYIFMEN